MVGEGMKKESILDKWLRETKALNLSFNDLERYVNNGLKCDYDDVYEKLEGNTPEKKAKILYDKWNKEEKMSVNVGDWLEFHNNGGFLNNIDAPHELNVPIRIIALEGEFLKGMHCIATFTTGRRVWISGHYNGKEFYSTLFKKVTPSNEATLRMEDMPSHTMSFSTGTGIYGLDPYPENGDWKFGGNVKVTYSRKSIFPVVEHQNPIILKTIKRKQKSITI